MSGEGILAAAPEPVSKPDYVPSHYPPVWLSSEDVREAIFELASNGADKAVCWDMMMAWRRLVEAAR